jgi:RNA polymerase sigma-70 factor (ECF subfamily)
MFLPIRKAKTRQEFEQVALPYLDSLYGTALRLCRNERDAEDLVQDTLLRAFRFFHRFERGTNAKAWLFKILSNAFVNRYHKRQRERTVIDEAQAGDGVGLFAQPAPGRDDPERALLSQLLSDQVKQALETLPEEFRLPVVLADLEDFSYREIADMMECPVGTVMSRLYRGSRMLQRTLRDYAREHGIGEPAEPAAASAPTRLQIVKADE